MSPTLLEGAVIIILIIVAWQIGLAIAPSVLRWVRALKQDVDEATEEVFKDPDINQPDSHDQKEHTNGTRH
jgi:hypothetical protein